MDAWCRFKFKFNFKFINSLFYYYNGKGYTIPQIAYANLGGDGAVVTVLASHQCGPGSIPRLGVMCGLSSLVLYYAPRGFSPDIAVFPGSPQKPTFDLICVDC